MREVDVDLGAEVSEDNRNLQPEKELWHPEKARMRLAYWVRRD